MSRQNPFKQQFVKMMFPEGSAGVMSIESFTLEEDEDGCTELPSNLVAAAESHGLVRATEELIAARRAARKQANAQQTGRR